MTLLRRAALQAGALVAISALAACSSSQGGASSGRSSANGGKSVTIAYSNAIMQVEKVPLHLAITAMKKDGIAAKETFNQNGNDAVQEVARGDADFGTANAATVFASIKKGVPIKAIMATYKPFYLLVAPSSVKDPSGLNGKRVGIQSKVSSTTFYTDLALATAPSARPKILIVPGSANRVQAMIAGQLDASMLQPADWRTLQKKAPGKFHVIYDVAEKNPDLIDSLIFANTKTLKTRPGYVKNFLGSVQKKYRNIYKNPAKLTSNIQSIVPKTSHSVAKELTKTLEQDRIWSAGGGLAGGTAKKTLNAMQRSGLFKASELPTASTCCTTKFLNGTAGG